MSADRYPDRVACVMTCPCGARFDSEGHHVYVGRLASAWREQHDGHALPAAPLVAPTYVPPYVPGTAIGPYVQHSPNIC